MDSVVLLAVFVDMEKASALRVYFRKSFFSLQSKTIWRSFSAFFDFVADTEKEGPEQTHGPRGFFIMPKTC